MGDRAIIVVKSDDQIGCCGVYLHWCGCEALTMLSEAIPRMRKGDQDYSIARLIGEFHNKLDGNTGLGVWPAPTKEDFENGFKAYTEWDAGVIVYDCSTGKVTCHAGYLTEKHEEDQFAVPPE